MRISRRVLCLLPRPLIASLSAFVWMVPTSASAQPNQPNQPNNAAGSGATGTSPAPPPAPASPATTAGSNGAAPAPAATAAPVMMVPPYGFPPAGTRLEGNLPSSSRATSDTSRSADGFDLNGASSGGERSTVEPMRRCSKVAQRL